jgi:hypothetical protein
MKYVLILKNGKIMVFHVKAVAELYRDNTGGTLVDASIIEKCAETCVQ